MMFKNFNLYNKLLENYSDYTSTEMLVRLYKFYFSFRYYIFAHGNRGQFIDYVSNVLNMKTIIIHAMVANPMIELIYFIPVDYSFLTKLT